MSDMPPEFYVPAFAALVSVIVALSGAVQALYRRYTRISEDAIELMALNSEALRANTDALAAIDESISKADKNGEIERRTTRWLRKASRRK